MRRATLLLTVVILATQAAAVGFGFTVSPRFLFPLHDPFEDDGNWERGVMAGFSFSFDISLIPGFTVGPYFGGLFPTDTYPLEWVEGDGKVFWTDLVVGARLKYSIPTGGPLRPWLSVAPGYGILSMTARAEYHGVAYETDYDNTGGFGLDAGIGVDYRISEVFFVGFGVDFHINTADKLELNVEGEIWDFELEESPVGLGFGFNAGINL